MPKTTHTFDHKPWLHTWLLAISNLRNTEQPIGLWIAYLADEDGVLSNYSWKELAIYAGMKGPTVRGLIRAGEQTRSELVSSGLVERKIRKMSNAYIIPKLTINLDRAAEMAEVTAARDEVVDLS